MPNGGFEALQESLITKQLAALIQLKVPAAGGDSQLAARPKQAALLPGILLIRFLFLVMFYFFTLKILEELLKNTHEFLRIPMNS